MKARAMKATKRRPSRPRSKRAKVDTAPIDKVVVALTVRLDDRIARIERWALSTAEAGERIAERAAQLIAKGAGREIASEAVTALGEELRPLVMQQVRPGIEAVGIAVKATARDMADAYDGIHSGLRALENLVQRTHPESRLVEQLARAAEYLCQCSREHKVPTCGAREAYEPAVLEARRLGLLVGLVGALPDKVEPSRQALQRALADAIAVLESRGIRVDVLESWRSLL